MNTELQVSLMCGRHIVDARAIHQGGLFRIPASAPFRFERLPPQTELDPEDAEVVIDFRDREPLLALPEGVRGEMAEGALPEAVSPGPRVLGDGSRGWVTLGQTTLYIQHGPIRPRAPRPRLPPGVHRWFDPSDRPLLAILTGALLAEGLLIGLVHRQPDVNIDHDEPVSELHAPSVRLLPIPTPPATSTAAPQAHAPPAAVRPRPRPPAPRPSGSNVSQAVGDSPLLRALGVASDNPVFKSGLNQELVDAFHGVKVRDVSDVDRTTHRNGSGTSERLGIGSIPLPGGEHPEVALRAHVGPPPIIEIRTDPIDPPEPGDLDDIHRIVTEIRQRKLLFQSCYEASLRLNPALKGKLTIQFDVSHDGRVDVSFPEDHLADGAVEQCIGHTAAHWRFSALRRPDSLSVSLPFIFAAAQ